jgi:hypothetical protein
MNAKEEHKLKNTTKTKHFQKFQQCLNNTHQEGSKNVTTKHNVINAKKKNIN